MYFDQSVESAALLLAVAPCWHQILLATMVAETSVWIASMVQRVALMGHRFDIDQEALSDLVRETSEAERAEELTRDPGSYILPHPKFKSQV